MGGPRTPVDPDAVQKYWNLKAELEALDDKLAALGNVEKTLAQGDRQLLVLDTTGDRVKAQPRGRRVGCHLTAEAHARGAPTTTTTGR